MIFINSINTGFYFKLLSGQVLITFIKKSFLLVLVSMVHAQISMVKTTSVFAKWVGKELVVTNVFLTVHAPIKVV